MPGRVHRPLAALVPVPPPTTGLLAVGHDPPSGKLGTGQLYRRPRRIFLTPSRPLIAARAILPRSPSPFRRSTVALRGLGRPRGSHIRRVAAPPTDAASQSAPPPQSRSAGVPPWAAASSPAPVGDAQKASRGPSARRQHAGRWGWVAQGRVRPFPACPGHPGPATYPAQSPFPGLSWPPAVATPVRHVATKMAALSSLPWPPCVNTSKVLCAVCPSEGCRRCLKLQRCVARIFNFTVSGPSCARRRPSTS